MIGTPDELLVAALGFCLYTYLGYPTLLKLVGSLRRAPRRTAPPWEWPSICITIPVDNEARVIAGTLERILELDYPAERRQILVVSDASSDRTDKIVSGFADRGVELLRLPERRGKTAAENSARAHLRGAIIINTDASVHIAPQALKPLVAAFADPTARGASLRQEYRRKVRTMARGLRTLWWLRGLLDPLRWGLFAWMLASHKLCRWLVPWALLGAVAALAALAAGEGWGWSRGALAGLVAVAVVGAAGWWWPEGERPPGLLALAAYLFAGNVAALHAWLLALLRARTAVWEPTRRSAVHLG